MMAQFAVVALFLSIGQALRPDQAVRISVASKGQCAPTPAPSAAANAEAIEAMRVFEDDDPLPPVVEGDLDLQDGSEELPTIEEAYNTFGFCPTKSKSERMTAATTAGADWATAAKMSQKMGEFNAGLMALESPINPVTSSAILGQGPVRIDSVILGGLNNILPKWSDLRHTALLTLALPAFLMTDGGNRTSKFYSEAVASCWGPAPMGYGPMVFKHSENVALITDPNQKRGYFTATVTSHSDFFHPEMLLFLDGDRHSKFRNLLEKSGFARRYPVDIELARQIPEAEGCTVPEEEVFAEYVGKLVQKAIWGVMPPPDVIAQVVAYSKYGPLGIFGEIIQPPLALAGIAGDVKKARDAVSVWGQTTPFADVFLKARDELFPGNPWFADGGLLLGESVNVASLFAGLVGTMDATVKCVKFQKQEERHHELFMEHPEKYLIEMMRFDSAVTSITDLYQEDTNMILNGRNVTMAKGAPRQVVIATANRDPMFWENPSAFDPDRSQLGETLSWNGRAEDVEARSLEKAPRHCPGMCLSLKVAAAVCASVMGVFEELHDQGKVLANDGIVKCNNFGDWTEPELWTPPAGPRATDAPPRVPDGAQPLLHGLSLLMLVLGTVLSL